MLPSPLPRCWVLEELIRVKLPPATISPLPWSRCWKFDPMTDVTKLEVMSPLPFPRFIEFEATMEELAIWVMLPSPPETEGMPAPLMGP